MDYETIDDTNADQEIPIFEDEEYVNPHEESGLKSKIRPLSCKQDLEDQSKEQAHRMKYFNEQIDDVYDTLETTKSGELLKRIISAESFGDHHIAIFDQWFKSSLPNTISAKYLLFNNGVKIHFDNLKISGPIYSRGTESVILTPKFAREQGITYGAELYVDMMINDENGDPLHVINGINIANIPLMLKSRYCVLRGKTPKELAMYGEDPKESGGYFILEGGVEKIIQGQEQLITDKILLMNTKSTKQTDTADASVRLTANTPNGTVVNEIVLDKETASILEMKLPKLKPPKGEAKNLNILRIFRILATWEKERIGDAENELSVLRNITDIYELISRFIKDDDDVRKKSLLKLNRSVVDFLILSDDANIIAKNMGKTFDENMGDDEMKEIIDKDIKDIFDTNFYPQLNNLSGPDGETPEERNTRITLKKLELLAIMTARLLEYLAGFRKLDDRDSWANKRVEGAGRLMEGLFRQAWKKTLGIIQEGLEKSNNPRRGTFEDLKEMASKIQSSTLITTTFRDSFITGKWGLKGTSMKENIAQPLVRDSVVATMSHINTVDVAISRTDRQQILRLVQMGQFGYIDPLSTPEGKNCGLLKNLCLLAKLSLGRTDTDIIRHLIGDENLDLPTRVVQSYQDALDNGLKDKIMVSAKFIGWGNAEEIRNDLIDRRRKGEFCYDMSVIKEDDWLYVDVSPSRLIRPLLIVNPDSQNDEYATKLRTENEIKSKVIERLKARENELNNIINIRNQVLSQGSILYNNRFIEINEANNLVEDAEYEIENIRNELDNIESELKFLMLDVKGYRYSSNYDMLVNGCMEYLSPWEQEYTKLAMFEEDIKNRLQSIDEKHQALIQSSFLLNEAETNGTAMTKENIEISVEEARNRVKADQDDYDKAKKSRPYTHCEIDPLDTMGVAASLIPWPNHNQAPRNTYQVSMGKQALGIYHSNHLNRMDGKTKTLVFPQRPMLETDMYSMIGLDDKGPGENINQAFIAYPYTEEDAFVVKKEFLENGGMRMYKYFTYKAVINEHNQTVMEVLMKPDNITEKTESKYRYIHGNSELYSKGLPKIGAPLREKDCVIGKMNYPRTDTKGRDIKTLGRNESIFMKVGDEGVVEKVLVASNGNKITVTVKLRIMRVPQEGDKYAPRNAQKATIGLVMSDVDLPFGLSGISPDYIANSHSMPSRMTMSYPMEMQSSKAGAMKGMHINGGAFQKYKMNENRETLKQYGMNEFGYEDMRSGTTGNHMEALIACGPVYFQALKHHVKDKVQARGTGSTNPMTRQPLRGRSNNGGLRWEEIQASAASKIVASHSSMWQHN